MSHAIRKLRRNWYVSWFRPLTPPQKAWGEFFPKKAFHGGWRGQMYEGGWKFESYSMVCWWRPGELVWPGDKPPEEVCLKRFWVGVNCLWYLAVFVIFMRAGRAKCLAGSKGLKVMIWWRASYKGERTILSVGGMTPLDILGLGNYILIRKKHHNILYFVNTA